jgi:hypothetical protein
VVTAAQFAQLVDGLLNTSSSDATRVNHCCGVGRRYSGAGSFLVSPCLLREYGLLPIACDQLVETISGWLYVPTGNLFRLEQVHPSQDLHCHVCLRQGSDHRSLCAFIVPNV